MKKLSWLIALVVAFIIAWYLNPSQNQEREVNEQELSRVSSFLLWQRRETEITYNYCRNHGYKLDKMIEIFNRINASEIARANKFIYDLMPLERYAFRRELNQAFEEMRPQIITQIDNSYDENKRAYALDGHSFSQKDYCKYIDEHAETLLRQKSPTENLPWK